MLFFPNCKINLGLHIVRKRQDGFHDLETVFYPLPLRDIIEVISNRKSEVGSQKPEVGSRKSEVGSTKSEVRSPESEVRSTKYEFQNSDFVFSISGLEVKGAPEDNLCIKAYELLKKDFPQLPPVQMHLHKAIPMGAGLGGGSADGAFMLQLLDKKFQLALSPEQLLDYSLRLGSDCPFFIINQPCFATGRGELLEKVHLDLSDYSFVLVHPAVHISTGWAFTQLMPAAPALSIKDIVQQPVESWKETLVNDFEAPVCRQHPELGLIKETLYNKGAVYASMTGSGSCFYGIFPKGKTPADLSFPFEHKVFHL